GVDLAAHGRGTSGGSPRCEPIVRGHGAYSRPDFRPDALFPDGNAPVAVHLRGHPGAGNVATDSACPPRRNGGDRRIGLRDLLMQLGIGYSTPTASRISGKIG